MYTASIDHSSECLRIRMKNMSGPIYFGPYNDKTLIIVTIVCLNYNSTTLLFLLTDKAVLRNGCFALKFVKTASHLQNLLSIGHLASKLNKR